MKKVIFACFMGLAIPLVGCGMLKQSNAAHHAIEDQNYIVDKVVVAKKNGRKSVTVHMLSKFSPDDEAKIKEIVKQKIPDAQSIKVVRGSGGKKIKGKPVKK